MSDVKHTPGPWFLDPVCNRLVMRDDEGSRLPWCVATCIDQCGWPEDRSLQNAQLISAAPELLALAKLVHGSFGGCLVMTFSEADVQAFEDAIAKAEGRS